MRSRRYNEFERSPKQKRYVLVVEGLPARSGYGGQALSDLRELGRDLKAAAKRDNEDKEITLYTGHAGSLEEVTDYSVKPSKKR